MRKYYEIQIIVFNHLAVSSLLVVGSVSSSASSGLPHPFSYFLLWEMGRGEHKAFLLSRCPNLVCQIWLVKNLTVDYVCVLSQV